MNILYIAYSCSPNYGSEDKIGWSIPLESAKCNNVHVLTKMEHKREIEEYLAQHGDIKVHFHFVDIPAVYKNIFKGSFYSGRLGIWNKRALKIARSICVKYGIELIHQITPVEFRSVGDYGKIPNIKYVCGPIAGGQAVPNELRAYLGTKAMAVETIRDLINKLYRLFVVKNRIKGCSRIIFANHETREFLEKYIDRANGDDVLSDVSIGAKDIVDRPTENNSASHKCRFLIVGRLVSIKGHAFALDALKRIPPELDYECRIVGAGPEMEHLNEMCKAAPLKNRVKLVGNVPFAEIMKEYDNADVLIMPSFREATGSVLMEAMARGVPVVTINKFGGATILDDDCGWLYDGNSREEYVENLKNTLISCVCNPKEIARKGKNARMRAEAYTWESRMAAYKKIYDGAISHNE